jgi:hypothetical protein
MKQCIVCKNNKPLSEFYKNRSKKDGYQGRCKPCDIIQGRIEYNKDKKKSAEKRYIKSLYREYNLTFEEYLKIKDLQNSGCAICKYPLLDGMNSHVDHDHSSGKVRGILCRWCNIGLGHFKDSVQTLEKAVQYLNQHSIKEI